MQGTDTTEFGTSSSERALYDLERVILDYPDVPAGDRFDVLVTYLNEDDTSGIGGNIQRLTAGAADEVQIHGPEPLPTATPEQRGYRLAGEAYFGGTLRLNFVRENGFRAVVSEVWLVERSASGDTTPPTSSITDPTGGAQLASTPTQVRGTLSLIHI